MTDDQRRLFTYELGQAVLAFIYRNPDSQGSMKAEMRELLDYSWLQVGATTPLTVVC